jgi:putative spermidine/putrescine transport system ATP-binding protein
MELAAMLRRLAITTVIVTHDQAEAMALGDRVAVMQEGRVEQVAEPQDVYERPATRFVAEFVGTLNLLEGTVVRGLLHLPGGRVPVPHAVDGPVQLGFRPEHLQPHPEGPLEGRIGQVLFLGDRLRLLVEDLAPTGVVVETTARGFVVGERRRFAFTADAPFPIPSSG